MKTLHLYDCYYFLSRCAGVLLEGRMLEPLLFEIEDREENEFLILQWEELHNDIPYLIEVPFKEGDNQTVKLEGSVLTLINSEGEEEHLTLLQEWHPITK